MSTILWLHLINLWLHLPLSFIPKCIETENIPALNVLTHQNRNIPIIQYFIKYHL